MSYVVKGLRKLERSARPLVQFACAYEFIALTLPKNRFTPPVSVVLNKYKWLMPMLFGAISAHVWYLETGAEK